MYVFELHEGCKVQAYLLWDLPNEELGRYHPLISRGGGWSITISIRAEGVTCTQSTGGCLCIVGVWEGLMSLKKFQWPKPETDPDHTVNKSCLTKAAFLSLFFSAYAKPHTHLPPHLCGQGVWFTTDPKLLLLPSHTVSSGITFSYTNRLAWCVSGFLRDFCVKKCESIGVRVKQMEINDVQTLKLNLLCQYKSVKQDMH